MKRRTWKTALSMVLTAAILAGCGGVNNGGTPGTGAGEAKTEEQKTEGQKAEGQKSKAQGGGTAAGNDGAADTGLSGQKLVVGTMAKAMGLPLKYALDKGYFADKGLEVEIVTFATGAPINEAMNAGELDVAVSGMASGYNLATGNYTYIGDTMISEEGQSLYIRPDSALASSGEKDGIVGSKETVKGISILGPLSTSAQYNAIKYVESFGLTSEDFTMVSMEYAQAYQAFITGEGDGIATIPPYSFQLEAAGYVDAADVATLMGQPLTDGIYVSNKVLEEKRGDLQVLMDVYYQACQELLDDPGMRAEAGMKWYGEEGVTYSDEDMENEIKAQTYTTVDKLKSQDYIFGATMANMGAFFTTQELIEASNLPNIEKSFDTSFVEHIIGTTVTTAKIDL